MGEQAKEDKGISWLIDALQGQQQPVHGSASIEPVKDGAEQTAYDGFSNLPPRRDLTARERDILCRVLGSLVYPFYAHDWDEPFNVAARAALLKHTRLDGDADTIQVIMNVLNPRDE